MNHLKKLAPIVLLFLVMASSCSYKKKNILFKTRKPVKTEQPVFVINPDSTGSKVYRHKIKPGDRLMVRFLNNYDLGQNATQSATSAANSQMVSGTERGYLVNYDSTVTLPLIGRVILVGLDRLEAAKFLEQEYNKFVNNTIIDVNIASLSVTVLGEVFVPGKIEVDRENTTLVDVIALAGGLKDAAKKNNIKIIRGTEVIIVNLKDIEALKSPDIVIHDNDIIYVEPYGLKAATEPISSAGAVTSIMLTVMQFVILGIQIYALTGK